MNLLSPARRSVARHPVAAFLIIGNGVYLTAVLIPPLVDTVRWRVPVRWYLVALFGVPVAATLVAIAISSSRSTSSPDRTRRGS